MTEIEIINKKIFKELKKVTKLILIRNDVDGDSDLIKSIDWKYKNNHFYLFVNDYYHYVSTGRRKGKMPPSHELIPWIKKNNLNLNGMTINQLAFVIANSIKKNGIKGKKYENKVVDVSSDLIAEDIAENLSTQITNELVNALEN